MYFTWACRRTRWILQRNDESSYKALQVQRSKGFMKEWKGDSKRGGRRVCFRHQTVACPLVTGLSHLPSKAI